MAVLACVVFVFGLTGFYYSQESGFNPNPQRSALPSPKICSIATQDCPGFAVGNASIRVLNRTDILSQQVSFTVTAKGATPMSEVVVFIENVSLGQVAGPFPAEVPKLVSLGVPTTLALRVGERYNLVIEGVYAGSGGGASTDYWQSLDLAAVGG